MPLHGAIHVAKSMYGKIDSRKIVGLLRKGMFTMAFVYPEKMRATRDLLRHRNHLMRKRAELLAQIQNTDVQPTVTDDQRRRRQANRIRLQAGHVPYHCLK